MISPTAAKVAATVQAIITARQDEQGYRLADMQSAARYAAVENTLRVWVKDLNTVVVSVVNTPDGHLFGYMCSEVLDRAASEAGVPFETAMIDQDERATIASLSW